LLSAFQAAGLLNAQNRGKIDEHFAKAAETVNRISSNPASQFRVDDVLMVPLISRTKALSDLARKLHEKRTAIFASITRLQHAISAFLVDKTCEIDPLGRLVLSNKSERKALHLSALSSGEKQILILLVQALLLEGRQAIFIADEPELSLHVTWQEKLLTTIRELAGGLQLMVATHSPDIVGPFRDKIIDLAGQ